MSNRTWGPFTGAQLTVMVTTALLCLAIPGGLWAAGVQFTSVALYDPKTTVTGKIIKGGALVVTDGAPADLVRFFAAPPSVGGCTPLLTAPKSKAFILTRMILNVSSVPPPGHNDNFYIGAGCSGTIFQQIDLTAVGVTTLDYGQGIVVPPGKTLSVSSTLPATILGVGHLVPAS